MDGTAGNRVAAFFVALMVSACTPGVNVIHTIPPDVSIVPAKVVAVVGTLKTADLRENNFLDRVVAELRGRHVFEVIDERAKPRASDWKTYLHETAADVIARVEAPEDNCSIDETLDQVLEDGDTYTYDVDCSATVELLNARTGATIGKVDVDGEATKDDRDSAWYDAIDDAVVQIVDAFTPWQKNEHIELDETAPLAGEGLTKIRRGDFNGARVLWEAALANSAPSAPLLYNLGVVCEALSNRKAAAAYYREASKLAPEVPRYLTALDNFAKREADDADAAKTQETLDAEAVAAAEERKAAAARAEVEKHEAAKARAVTIAATAITAPAGLSFLLIPAGTFTMGCTNGELGCQSNENPSHPVTITKPFYFAFTPTTNFQYQQCVDAGACHATADMTKQLNPVVNVSWNDANEYCVWAGARLPTEAEWEYAARGGTEGWRYPWGNEGGINDANLADNHGRNVEYIGFKEEKSTDSFKFDLTYPFQGTSPVGTFERNGFGLYDMAGNAAQWTSDWFGPYSSASQKDPTGPATGDEHVIRGGSWVATIWGARVSVRYSEPPDFRRNAVGFRCARDAAGK